MSSSVSPCVIAALAGACIVVSAQSALAQEAPAREYVVDSRRPPPSARWKLVLGGLGTTAAFYAAAQPFSYAWPDAPGGRDLRIPVAGPWIAIAHNGCADDNPGCSKTWVVMRTILTALDGLGQAGGLGLTLEGLFMPTGPAGAAPKPRPSSPEDPSSAPTNLFMAPAPVTVGRDGVGLGLIGVF